MEEKILLEEIKKEQEKLVKERFLEQKKSAGENLTKTQEKSIEKLQSAESKPMPKINVFSSSAFSSTASNEVKLDTSKTTSQADVKQSKASQVVETPNYDFIETLSNEEREKIFVFPQEKEQASPKSKKFKLKYIIISILFALFGVWGIVNIATLDNVTTQYSVNLATYLNNLHNLDATNAENMENLFDTIPEESLPPSTIEAQSNWFDRFCNFLAGLFGG